MYKRFSHIFAVPMAVMFLLLSGCALSEAGVAKQQKTVVSSSAVAPEWQYLFVRLQNDGLGGADLVPLFNRIALSEDPMGRKIRELYVKAFPPPKPPQTTQTPPTTKPAKPAKPPVYPGVVTEANAQQCVDFLKTNQAIFTQMERRYGVPHDIAAGLLFVETRLGTATGKENAFKNLASMASLRDPEQIPNYLAKMSHADEHTEWIKQRMQERSDWAYKELVALLVNSRANGRDLSTIPGSIYGAIGYCQFMPSNIVPYGADGNADGVIDLFTLPDAVASLSNYLVKHGWKPSLTRLQRHRVLKRYNNANIYANTILALSDLILKKEKEPAQTTPAKQAVPTKKVALRVGK